MSFTGQMLKISLKDAPEEKLKKIKSAYADMSKGIRSFAVMVGAPKEGQTLFANIIGVMKVDDAPAYINRQEKAMKTLSEALKGLDVPFAPPTTSKRVKVDGRPGLESVTDLTASPGLDEAAKQIIENIFGARSR